MHFWGSHPSSTLDQLQIESGVGSKTTIIDFANFFRDICQEWAVREQATTKLGGPQSVVEIDESKFYKGKLVNLQGNSTKVILT